MMRKARHHRRCRCRGADALGFDRVKRGGGARRNIELFRITPIMIDRFGERMKVTRDAGIDVDFADPIVRWRSRWAGATTRCGHCCGSGRAAEVSLILSTRRTAAWTARGLCSGGQRETAKAAGGAYCPGRRRLNSWRPCWRADGDLPRVQDPVGGRAKFCLAGGVGYLSGAGNAGVAGRERATSFRGQHLWLLPGRSGGILPA